MYVLGSVCLTENNGGIIVFYMGAVRPAGIVYEGLKDVENFSWSYAESDRET